jgi:hypothetical protein
MFYTEPRATKDLDVWVIPEMNRPERVYDALREFGAPLQGVLPTDFADKTLIYQIGVPPVRVDIMMDVPGVEFRRAWKMRRRTFYGKTPIHVIGREDLILAKQTANRPQDRLDLRRLRLHARRRRS